MGECALTPQQEVLLALVAACLHDEPASLSVETVAAADPAAVLEEAQAQTVFLMAWDAAAAYTAVMSPELIRQSSDIMMQYLSANREVMYDQAQLLSLCGETDTPCLILKGLAAASRYSRPELRILGDVDVLIEQAQQPPVIEGLLRQGYRQLEEENACHRTFLRKRSQIELHFEISGIPDGPAGERIRAYMTGAVTQPEEREVSGCRFSAPSPDRHGLILLLHMQHHMVGEGLGLRHLCDWACFVEGTKAEPFWETSLLPLLKEIGLYRYACAVTHTAARYLHTACPAWAGERDEALCAALIRDVLDSGNFGRKNKARSSSGLLISEHGKDPVCHRKGYYLRKRIRHTVTVKYPVTKAHPVLYPLFWVRQLLCYGWLTLTGRRSSPQALMRYADERKELYRRLALFEPSASEKE